MIEINLKDFSKQIENLCLNSLSELALREILTKNYNDIISSKTILQNEENDLFILFLVNHKFKLYTYFRTL